MFTPKSGGMATPTSSVTGSGGHTDRSYMSASARAVAAAAARRRSTGVSLLSSGAKRSPFNTGGYQISDRAGAAIASSVLVDFGLITKDKMQNVIDKRTTPLNRSLQTSQIIESGGGHYNVEGYGSSLPALVMEVLAFADKNAELSAVLAPSGWAWLVAGRRVLIWRYRGEGSRRIADHQFRELTLPPSDLAHRAQLVAVFSQTDGQVPSCIAVSPEGFVRYWPNITHEGSYYEVSTDLQGQECDSLLFLGPSLGCLLATTTSTILQIQPASGSVAGGHINLHHLKPPAGILGGISRRVSSLVFGSMPTQAPEARLVGVSVVETGEVGEKSIVVLSARSLQKWFLSPGHSDKLLYECNVDKIIHETLIDHVWGRDRVVSQLQVWLVAVQNISDTGSIMILTAAVNSHVSQQLVYSLVTLDTSGTNPPQSVSGFFMLKHSEYYQESSESLILSQRFLNFGSTAYIYTKNSVLCVPIATSLGESDGGDRLEFSSAGDSILGVGRTLASPLFFSANHGIVSVSPSSVTSQPSFLANDSVIDESIDLSNITCLGGDTTNISDTSSQLQAAFLQFNRRNVIQAQSLLEELFPNGDNTGLDSAVVQLSTQLLDDIPASDPRWAQAKESSTTSNASSTTSLIIANQIRDKIMAHQYFITFLQKTGLWQRLGIAFVGDRKLHGRILLAEHCELLYVASTLKNLHQDYQALLDAAIRFILADRGETPTEQLSNSDIFYRRVSRIDSIIWGLIQAQEEVLSADVSPRDASLTIHNVNAICLSLLKSAREAKLLPSAVSTRSVANETQVEYVPWVSSEGPRGLRQLLTTQHTTTVEIGLSRAEDGAVRSRLYSQIVELTDEILSGFQPHLSSLASINHPRHQTVVEDYQRLRYSFLQPLVKGEQYDQAVGLAEKFCDFRTLVEVCDKTNNQERLNQYMTQFGSQGFSDFVFRWYLETGKRGKLLTHGSADTTRKDLARFLQDYSSLAWIHQINSRDFDSAHKTLKHLALEETAYLSKKKTLLSLSKLCGLARGSTNLVKEEDIEPRVRLEEDLILYQEQLPEVVLNAHSITHDDMRVFSPKELIHLYISEENTCANEFDLKKALELLAWIDDPEEVRELRRLIWVRAVLRNSWKHIDTDNPIDAMSDTIFFRTVELAFSQGCDMKELLIPADELLDSEELGSLRHDSAFQFLIKAGYEKVNELST